MEHKFCRHCENVLPLTQFNKNRHNPDGLQTWCRSCQRAWRPDPDRQKQPPMSEAERVARKRGYYREYYAQHRDTINERRRVKKQESAV